jgi:hypothetical protein
MVTTIHGWLVLPDAFSDDLTVELRRRDGERVASTAPAPDGRFQMMGLDVAPQRRHELLLEVQRGGVLVERAPVLLHRWGPEVEVVLELDERAWGDDPLYRVRGQLRNADGRPLRGQRIEVVDRDLRSEQPLGEKTTSDSRGLFCVEYRAGEFRRAEKGSADLVVRAYEPRRERGEPIAESKTVFNAGRVEVVDLMVGGGTWAGPSEFERVWGPSSPRSPTSTSRGYWPPSTGFVTRRTTAARTTSTRTTTAGGTCSESRD